MDLVTKVVDISHPSHPPVERAKHAALRSERRLLTVAQDRGSLRARFPVWPEEVLMESDWDYLFRLDGEEADAETVSRLSAAGLLHRCRDQLVRSVVVHGTTTSLGFSEQLGSFGRDSALRLQPFIEHLRQEWQSAQVELPAWDEIAHSLVFGWLFGACGGQVLLNLLGAPVGAVLVETPARLSGVWLSFMRLRHDLALVDLVGAPYPSAEKLQRLLSAADVRNTLASVDEQGQLIMYGDRSLGLLKALSCYQQTSSASWQPSEYRLVWPVITPDMLRALANPLGLMLKALKLTLGEMVALVGSFTWPAHLMKADIAFSTLLSLCGLLHLAWVEQGALPAPVIPWLGDY